MFVVFNDFDRVTKTSTKCAVRKESVRCFNELMMDDKKIIRLEFSDGSPVLFITDAFDEVVAKLNIGAA